MEHLMDSSGSIFFNSDYLVAVKDFFLRIYRVSITIIQIQNSYQSCMLKNRKKMRKDHGIWQQR